MVEDQWCQLLELADRVIRCGDSLASLHTSDADANMSLCNHSNIICAVTD